MIHVAARTIATHALSIFGDHSDVMHATLRLGDAIGGVGAGGPRLPRSWLIGDAPARVPFLHFFDGFRTSHEIDKITLLPRTTSHAGAGPEEDVAASEAEASRRGPPRVGHGQNPDVFPGP